MFNKLKLILGIILFLNFFNLTIAKENFFNDAKNKFDAKKLEESKFLFQRNIVFNPKDAQSYLYLAKIYNSEENEKEEEKNLKTTLLLSLSSLIYFLKKFIIFNFLPFSTSSCFFLYFFAAFL